MALLPPTGKTSALQDADAHAYTDSKPTQGSLEVEDYFYIELMKQ